MNILVDNFEQYRAYVWSIKKINRFLDVRKLNTRLQPDLIYQTRRLHLPRTHFSSYWPWCCVLTQALYSHRYLHFILSILVLAIANSRKKIAKHLQYIKYLTEPREASSKNIDTYIWESILYIRYGYLNYHLRNSYFTRLTREIISTPKSINVYFYKWYCCQHHTCVNFLCCKLNLGVS